MALVIRNTVAVLVFGAALLFGSAGTAHARGTFTPPTPHSPLAHTRHGPFSVLHQGPLPVQHPGPSSVLRETG